VNAVVTTTPETLPPGMVLEMIEEAAHAHPAGVMSLRKSANVILTKYQSQTLTTRPSSENPFLWKIDCRN
jgi:hypothetical protein